MKHIRRTLILLLILLCAACAAARAEETFTLRVEAPQSANQTNAKKKYDRDLLTPLINGENGFIVKQGAKTNTYLFSFDPEYTPELTLRFEGSQAAESIQLDGQPVSGEMRLALGEELLFDVTTASGKTSLRVTVTSLPIAAITCSVKSLSETEETANASFVLLDPAYQARGYADYRFESAASVTYRGNTARYYTRKRNFSVELLSEKGEKRDMSLLGMRIDNSWILDGMYNDTLRMRNHVAFQLWDEFFEAPYNEKVSGAIKGAFVEVFLNGEYKGVYCLNERVDRKLLKLDKKNGILYRSTLDWKGGGNIAGFRSKNYTPPTAADEWYNFQIRYPNDGLTVESWSMLSELCRLVMGETDAVFSEKIGELTYIDNLIDYYLFVNIIGATDNMCKNMFWACENKQDSARIALFPWDMDAVLGRRYNGIRTAAKENYSNLLFDRLIELNADGFNDRAKARYAALRSTFLTTDHIMALIRENYAVVERAGGWAREMNLLPYFTDHQRKNTLSVNPLKEMDVVQNYLTQHLEWLDKKMGFER